MTLMLSSTAARHFLVVARHGAITRAAEQLHVAASAISRQIAALEAQTGVALFERRQRGMRLTAAGEALLAFLDEKESQAARVLAQMRGGSQAAERVLRLISTEGFVTGLLPQALQALRLRDRHLRIEWRLGRPDEVSDALLQGRADLGLKYSVHPDAGLRVLHSAQAPVLAVMSRHHRLAGRRSIALAEAVQHPLLMGEADTTARQLFDRCCAGKGLQYVPSVISTSGPALLSLMGPNDILLAGRWILGDAARRARLVALPFAESGMRQRQVQLLCADGRRLPETAEPLRDALIQVLRPPARTA